jgi:predicted HicB family RNase H-like nuclease
LAEKTITIRVSDELHKAIKIKVAKESMSLKDYVIGLIESDLKKK